MPGSLACLQTSADVCSYVQGMKALHDCKRCLFDLKPANILVSNWMDPARVCCTILDLGGSLEEGTCESCTVAVAHPVF